VDEGSARAALRAALGVASSVTGLGPPCYEPAPLGGGGLLDAPAAVAETMFCDPYTGIVYTPPRFSDHVAVSCVLRDDVRSAFPKPAAAASAAAALRHAQPHKLTAPITHFFKAARQPQDRQVVDGAAEGVKRAAEVDAADEKSAGVHKKKAVEEGKAAGKGVAALGRLFHFGGKARD
jgi:hypothetical protein